MKNQKGNPNQIKPTELRIGNLVYENKPTLTPRRIGLIGADFVHLGAAGLFMEVATKDILPIPLTEEMLLKLGFENIDSGHSEDHEDFHEWLEKDYPTLGCVYSGDGDYVFCEKFDDQRIYDLHQLQNLHFALTGEELKIEL